MPNGDKEGERGCKNLHYCCGCPLWVAHSKLSLCQMYVLIQTSVEHEATAFGNKCNRLLPVDETILFPSILAKQKQNNIATNLTKNQLS